MKNSSALAIVAVLVAACSSQPERVYPPSNGTGSPVSNTTYDYPRPSALDNAGRSSMASGDLSGAEESFQKELDNNPFDPIALNNLAVAKSEEGKYSEALSLLERATKLAPDNVEIAANLTRMRAYESSLPAGSGPATQLAGGGGYPVAGGSLPEPPPLWQPLAVGVPVTTPVAVRRAHPVRNGCYSRAFTAPSRETSQVRVCDAAQ